MILTKKPLEPLENFPKVFGVNIFFQRFSFPKVFSAGGRPPKILGIFQKVSKDFPYRKNLWKIFQRFSLARKNVGKRSKPLENIFKTFGNL